MHRSSQLEELISFLRSEFHTVATLCADIVNNKLRFIHNTLQTQSLVIRIHSNFIL